MNSSDTMSVPSSAKGRQEHVAHALGQTLATLQHLADLTLSWGFRKLKKISAPDDGERRGKGVLPFLRRAGWRSVSFLGSMGDAYYEWYERLKARRARK